MMVRNFTILVFAFSLNKVFCTTNSIHQSRTSNVLERTRDQRLCENEGLGSSKSISLKCIVKDPMGSCKEFKTTSDSICDSISLQIPSFSIENLLAAVENVDTDLSVKRLVINFKNSTNDLTMVGQSIDQFLLPRPWWRIVKEPFSWQKHPHREVILERYYEDWEKYFQYLARVHYPSSQVCSKTTLLVGKNSCVHPGWFSVLSFYKMTHGSHPYAIHTIYYPELVDLKHQSNAWITNSDCPQTLNKWNCAFLPTTNCTIPKYIIDCNNDTCNNEQNDGFSLYMDKADYTGQKIPSDKIPSSGKSSIWDTTTPLPPISMGMPSAHAVLPFDREYVKANHNKRDILNIIDLTAAAFIHKFLLRQNAFYRSKVAQIIHKFRVSSSPHLDATASCVAVQLRRGDRAIPAHLDPEEYCYNATHKLPCDGGYCNPDLGCNENGGVPFAAINLSHVVDKVPMLVGPLVKNLLVFSDDPHWLQLQIAAMKKISPSWNIYTLPAPKPKEEEPKHTHEPSAGYHYMRSEGGTESGTFLFASIELASQCDAFIGHLGSGSTMMYHHYMCMNHAGMSGVCPPTYDMRHGLWLN